uniref:RINT1-like protein MAG2 n=1 Tax=Rhizophora mucronata TaxID=61149 RepID=A0A2P2JQS2_RHIMU
MFFFHLPETALKLDTLVGDIEDGVSSAMRKNLGKNSSGRSSEGMCLHAIETLGQTEDVLTSVAKTRPQWMHLVSAVDHRVDRSLAILRPQAIADHRTLLTSLGWPPPLSTLTSSNIDAAKSTEIPNLLFTIQGNLKHQYCENFLALCRLQELQRRRKSRQLVGHNREVALLQPLWAIEELVNPISIACQRHFLKWVDKPEFIFALVYKIIRDYVDTMDDLLQPLVDEARLSGYSCREEWVSAMVMSLLTYLAKEIFPIYISQLAEENGADVPSQAKISWLHLVDLMIAFDKQIQSLVTHSGILNSLPDDERLQKISSLSLFCDRPDWLDIWAEMELNDMLEKLKPDLDDERNWTMKNQGAILSTGSVNYKSPAISSAFLQRLSLAVDRCRSLPTISLRSRFLKLVGVPIIQRFLDCVLHRCQEAEGLTALTDDDGLIKVANSINAIHYFESVVKEWCDDVFFLEIGFDNSNQMGMSDDDAKEKPIDGSVGIFDGEIGKTEDFRKEWIDKISIVILRGFDAKCRDYVKARKQWQEKSEEGWTVSRNLVEALDYLQEKIAVVEENLNRIDFVCLWRSLAAGLDRLLFNSILMSNVKFHDCGVERFGSDLQVLFGIFGAWCLRPEGFFPKASEGLKLLQMREKQLKYGLARGRKWMKENGIRHLSVAEAEKIVSSRVFMN